MVYIALIACFLAGFFCGKNQFLKKKQELYIEPLPSDEEQLELLKKQISLNNQWANLWNYDGKRRNEE